MYFVDIFIVFKIFVLLKFTYFVKENAHFWICEAVIEAIELMKWKGRSTDTDIELPRIKQRIRFKKDKLSWKARNNITLSDNSFNGNYEVALKQNF